jgi:hypothetical protein
MTRNKTILTPLPKKKPKHIVDKKIHNTNIQHKIPKSQSKNLKKDLWYGCQMLISPLKIEQVLTTNGKIYLLGEKKRGKNKKKKKKKNN